MFVLDVYNKYGRNDDVCDLFNLFNRWYCIREVNNFDWGQPIIPDRTFDEGSEHDHYHLFATLEDARQAVKKLKMGELIDD